jgi:hypothetical protein
MNTIALVSFLTPAVQSWLAAGLVALTLAAFAWRAWRKAHGKSADAHSCGCGTDSCGREGLGKLRR